MDQFLNILRVTRLPMPIQKYCKIIYNKNCGASSLVRAAALSGQLFCQGSCSVRAAALSGQLLCQGSCSVRAAALSGKLLCQGSCSVRDAALSGQLLCQGSCSIRTAALYEQLLLNAKWTGWAPLIMGGIVGVKCLCLYETSAYIRNIIIIMLYCTYYWSEIFMCVLIGE